MGRYIQLGKEAAEGYLYLQFEGLIGKLGALQLQEMINNVKISGDTPWVTALGVATFFLGATGVFIEIQDSAVQVRFRLMAQQGPWC